MKDELLDQASMLKVMRRRLTKEPGTKTTVDIWNTGVIDAGDEFQMIRGFLYRQQKSELRADHALRSDGWDDFTTVEQELHRSQLTIRSLKAKLTELETQLGLEDRFIAIEGQITKQGYGDSDDVLFVGNSDEPLAEFLKDKIVKKQVSVRYWVTDQPCSKNDAQLEFIKHLCGAADCKFAAHYSELTGYLWTDEELKIGGHDLLQELYSHVGKWLFLEIEIVAVYD